MYSIRSGHLISEQGEMKQRPPHVLPRDPNNCSIDDEETDSTMRLSPSSNSAFEVSSYSTLPIDNLVTSNIEEESRKTCFVQIASPVAVSVPSRLDDDSARDYVWQNHGAKVRQALAVRPEARVLNELEQYKRRFELLDRVALAQTMFLRGEARKAVFQCLLDALLDLMNSEYGFIGHVEYDEDKSMHLRVNAITNIAWNAVTRKLYEENLATGLRFSNMKTLFGHCLVHKEPVISNDPANDPRSAGLPPGHPALNHFLGIPFFCNNEIVGMIGISNRPGGYIEEDLHYLEPFMVTCSSLILSYRQKETNDDLINTLEQKVMERTQKLEKANADLEAANRKVVQASQMQLQHFACMSHEIRTPLNCILGLSSLLQETRLDAQQADAVQMMTTSGDLLLTVVNDVLDYSKLETGNVDIEISDTFLQDTINAVIQSIETKAADKKVSVTVHCSTSVPARLPTDGRRLQQILYNLLGNATKFSRSSGVVRLRVSTVEKEEEQGSDEQEVPETMTCPRAKMKAVEACPHLRGNGTIEQELPTVCPMKNKKKSVSRRSYLRFDVIDYGKGIPRSDFESIFKPFVQSGSDTEAVYGGTGLGLAITSKLVKALGGEIAVDSIVGEMTKFTVDLPLPGNALDKTSIRSSLEDTSIFVVGAPQGTKTWMEEVAHDFSLKVDFSDSLSETVDNLTVGEGQRSNSVVLVQEDLYDDLRLSVNHKNLQHATFLTYGSGYNVSTSRSHYRCLERMIPAVLLKSLAVHAERKGVEHATGTMRRRRSCHSAIQNLECRVLVAEDNIVNQKVLLRLLKQLGIREVEVVDNGKKAWDRAIAKDFDVVLMDKQMPVMNGLDSCLHILEDKRIHRKPKMVMVTAAASKAIETRCREVGFTAFLPKPYSLRDIEQTFRELHRDGSSFSPL